MVSTLRITSVVVIFAAALVVVLVAGPSSSVPSLLAGFAVRNDPEIERILNEPSVVEAWVKAHGESPQSGQGTTPPLVREAEAFKNILDPPPAPVSATAKSTPTASRPRAVAKPVPSSAKFDLVGTTVSLANSFAYVRLPDKTYRWVREGDEIGHLLIKEVRNGSIVCWDGHADVEMVTESVPVTSGLIEVGGSTAPQADSRAAVVAPPAGGRITGQPAERPWAAELSVGEDDGPMNEQEQQEVGDFIGRLRELQKSVSSTPDPNSVPQDADEAVKKLMAEYKSSRVSPEEAEKVEDLGRELNESAAPSPGNKLSEVRRKLHIPRVIQK